MNSAILFNEVHRHFGTKRVLRGLSFAVAPGEVFALLGRNGQGKSTALNILLGFLAPHRGRASILGVEGARLGADERARIGYVGEGHRLYRTMRIRDAIAFERATRPAFRGDFAQRAIERCELDPKQHVGLLSRGQRAQLSLILAVAARPEILVFDDPAAGLDVGMRRALLDALVDLLSDTGCAVLFTSHILSDVERIADRIGILRDGRLVVDATLDDVKRRVERRLWTRPERPDIPGQVRARQRSGGWEITLVDPPREAIAAQNGSLSDPLPASLDDVFLDIAGEDAPRILPDLTEPEVSR